MMQTDDWQGCAVADPARATTGGHPLLLQAHFINNRTMEVFRQMRAGEGAGATLASRVAEASPPLSEWRKFVYCETVTGRVFGEVDHFKAGPPCEQLSWPPCPLVRCLPHAKIVLNHPVCHRQGQSSPRTPGVSPEPVAHLSQHRLLPLLLSCAAGPQAKGYGSVHFGQRVSAATQSGGSVLITASDMQVRPTGVPVLRCAGAQTLLLSINSNACDYAGS